MMKQCGALVVLIGLVFGMSDCKGQQTRPWWERPPCPELKTATSDDLVHFLEGESPSTTAKSDCVADAIVRLAREQHVPAAGALIRYLGFVDPYFEIRLKTHISEGLLAPWDKYPAIGALSATGKAAEPQIIHAIGFGDMTDLARRNAVTVLMIKYTGGHEKLGVVLLNDANRSSRDAIASARLLAAAREAVSWCPQETRFLCEAVILDQSGK